MCPPQYNQSNEILSCSNGIGTKLSNTIDLEASSGSVCGGTSSRMRSGLIDSSASRYRRKSASLPYPERHNGNRTFSCKVEQEREFLSVGHPRTLPSKLVEEWMTHRLDRTQACLGGVLEQFRDEIDGLCRRTRPEDLGVPASILCLRYEQIPRKLTFEKGWGLICGNLCSI